MKEIDHINSENKITIDDVLNKKYYDMTIEHIKKLYVTK